MSSSSASAGNPAWGAVVQAGLLVGAMAVTFSISHASLVTTAQAPQATATLVGMTLTGSAVLCVLLGFFSSVRGLIPISQDVPAAALGAIVLAMLQTATLPAGDAGTATIAALSVFTTFTFAASFFLFGRLKLGGLMRYAPRPMIAGFLAGTGWFVMVGALGICAGEHVEFSNLNDLLKAPTILKVFTAFSVALLLILGNRHLPKNSALPAVVIGSILAVHMLALLTQTSLTQMTQDGWFVYLPTSGALWPTIHPSDLLEVDLRFLGDQIFPILSMVLLATIAFLMNASALEVETRVDLRLDREMKVLGLGNLAAGVLGGMPGYHGVSTTLAGHRIAGQNRAVSYVAAATLVAVLALGDRVLTILPMPVLAGFMLWVGAGMLREWLVSTLQIGSRKETLLTTVIFAVIVLVGLFEGTVFGLLAGAMLFVVDYSRMDPVRTEVSGKAYHGSSEVSSERLKILQEHGGQIAIQKIQGFVFFGTAHKLRERILRLLASKSEVTHLMLDFSGVTGLDSTAIMSFDRIQTELEEQGVTLYLTSVPDEIVQVMIRSGVILGESGGGFRLRDDLDSGLRELEELILAQVASQPATTPDIHTILSQIMTGTAAAEHLLGHMEKLQLADKDTLFAAGDPPDGIYILESGKLGVFAGRKDAPVRLRDLTPGAIIGEIAYYLQSPRTAAIVALEPTVIWKLSSLAANQVLQDNPELAARFHSGIATALARRVDANTRVIQTLRA